MSVVLKPGARLRSVTCSTEILVVRSPAEADLRCGGHAMVDAAVAGGPTGEPASGFDEGTLIGKRYADEVANLEVLCTKGGSGSLSLGDTLLKTKEAKGLPSSD
jgi:hypothetical protein